MATQVLIRLVMASVILYFVALPNLFRNDVMLPCPNPIGADTQQHPECFFSENYEAARILFRKAASAAGAQLHALPLFEDLTIDVAVIYGADQSKLLLHVSGTHGVEGFVGSAVQTAFLREFAKRRKGKMPQRTLVLVHALNAYGMANWRRVNENNVDLNRNALFEEEARRRMHSRDSNLAGYDDFDYVFNPKHAPQPLDDWILLSSAIRALLTHASPAHLKRSMVTGTYTKEKGIFYGGRKVEKSHELLREFLEYYGFLRRTTDLIVVDVHSGLGPLGNDTMMMNEHLKESEALLLRPENGLGLDFVPPYALELQLLPIGASANEASEGYDLVAGDVQAHYHKLFPYLNNFLSVTEEFGTVHPFLVVSEICGTCV
jgi:hypothetical protein